ncbi:MAG TPA: phage minor head protein [Xanthobacteraceae bacterium]|nr:phage minor head protein [Xanthobacteraceae bacterium]
MAVHLEALPPFDAIRALEARGKRLAPSFAYQDVWEEEHAAQFTVAKSTGFDILQDIHGGLLSALKEGKTGREFAAGLRPLLEAKGWWGRQPVLDPATGETVSAQLGSPRRLDTIFDANMRVSYAAGHWAQFERTKATRPYLRYVAVMDGRTRPEHAARHNLCLRVDDPYWDVWAPPCGWSCRCTLQSMSERDVERMRGVLIFKPPPDRDRDWTNHRTGEVIRVPEGIDPGWGHNPGRAGHQAVLAADKLVAAPPALAATAVADPAWPAQRLADEFGAWMDALDSGRRVNRSLWPVGALDRETLAFLGRIGEPPQSGAITVQQGPATHMMRDSKRMRGAAVPAALLRRIPELLARPRAVLFDKRNPALLYVFDVPGDDRLGKLVVRIDYMTKARHKIGPTARITTNAIRTAGMVARDILEDQTAYDVISGSV